MSDTLRPIIVLTRPESPWSRDGLERSLREAGYDVIRLPVLEIRTTASSDTLRETIRSVSADEFHWIVFASPTAVRVFGELLKSEGATLPAAARIAVQGDGTAQALREVFQREADLVPELQVAEALLELLLAKTENGSRLLIPGSSQTRDVIAQGLEERGREVIRLATYDTVPTESPGDPEISRGCVTRQGYLVFMSPSAVRATLTSCHYGNIAHLKAISIGPITSSALLAAGLPSPLEASEASEEGILVTIMRDGNS